MNSGWLSPTKVFRSWSPPSLTEMKFKGGVSTAAAMSQQRCEQFNRGRGKQSPHREGAWETNVNEVHLDISSFGREGDPLKTMAVLVAKERTSNMVMSAVVPRKTARAYIAKRVAGLNAGNRVHAHGDMEVKSDQEPTLLSIVEDIDRWKMADGNGRYVVEYCSVGASKGKSESCSALWRKSGIALCRAIIRCCATLSSMLEFSSIGSNCGRPDDVRTK